MLMKLKKSTIISILSFLFLQNLTAEQRLKWILTTVNKQPNSTVGIFEYPNIKNKSGVLNVVKPKFGGSEFEVLNIKGIADYIGGKGNIWYLVDYHEKNMYPFWTQDIEPFESLKKKNLAKYKNRTKKLKKFNSAVFDLGGFWLSGPQLGEWILPDDAGLGYATLDMPAAAERIFISVEENSFFLWSYQTDGIGDYIATGFKKVSDDEFTFELNGKIKATFYMLGPDKMKVVAKGEKRGNFSKDEYYRISDKDGFVPPDFYKEHIDLNKVKPRKLKQ